MNVSIKTVAGLLLIALTFTSLAQQKLYFFTEQYPPYNMTDDGRAFAHKADEITGLCTDVIKAVIRETPYDSRIKLRNWKYGMERSKRKANTGVFCAARSPEREALFHWVGPITNLGWALFSLPGSDIKLNSLEDARDYKIGGYKGDVMSNYLIEKGFNVELSDSSQMVPRRLQLGQVDLWVTDQLSGPYTAADAAELEIKEVLTFRNTPMFLAINRDTSDDVINTLQSALDKLRNDGVLAGIEQAYGR